MFSVRPCRSATIRTEGFDHMMANGYFLGGSVGAKDFDIDYRFNSQKNPQTYAVHVGVTAVYAIANLLFIPEVVKGRVSGIVASQVNGSVLVGRKWVVP